MLASYEVPPTVATAAIGATGVWSVFVTLGLPIFGLMAISASGTIDSGAYVYIGLLGPAIAEAFGKSVVWLLHYLTTVVRWIAGLPAAKTQVTFSIVAVALSYIFISIVILWLWRVTGHNYRRDLAIQKEF